MPPPGYKPSGIDWWAIGENKARGYEEVTGFEQFAKPAISAATLHHYVPEEMQKYPERFEGIKSKAGGVVGGIAPYTAALSLPGIREQALSQIMAMGFIGNARPSDSPEEKRKNIAQEIVFGTMLKGVGKAGRKIAPKAGAKRLAIETGLVAPGAAAVAGGFGAEFDEALESGITMGLLHAGMGARGAYKAGKPTPKPTEGVEILPSDRPGEYVPMERVIPPKQKPVKRKSQASAKVIGAKPEPVELIDVQGRPLEQAQQGFKSPIDRPPPIDLAEATKPRSKVSVPRKEVAPEVEEGFRFVEEGEVLPAGDYVTKMDLTTERSITNAPKAKKAPVPRKAKEVIPEPVGKEVAFKSTEEALAYGKSIKGDKVKIAELKRLNKEAKAETKKLGATDEGVKSATRSQFYREALEVAEKSKPVKRVGKEAWEVSDLLEKPNIPIDRVEAKKLPDGKYKLFFRGTRNEVFSGEIFNTASEARAFFKVQKLKATKASEIAKPSTQTGAAAQKLYSGLPIPDRVTLRTWAKEDVAIIQDVGKSLKRSVQTYKELPESIRSGLTEAKIGVKKFWDSADKLVRGVSTGLKENVERIVRAGVQWLKDNMKMRRGSVSVAKIKKAKPATGAAQRQAGRVVKSIKGPKGKGLKDPDLNKVSRELFDVNASKLNKNQLQAAKNQLKRNREKGYGITKEHPLHPLLVEELYKNRGLSNEAVKRMMKKRYNKERFRDLSEEEGYDLLNYARDEFVDRAPISPKDAYKEAENWKEGATRAPKKAITVLRDTFGPSIDRWMRTKAGKELASRFGRVIGYEGQLEGPWVVRLTDAFRKSQAKDFEFGFRKWTNDNLLPWIESKGSTNKPPAEFKPRAEAMRKAWLEDAASVKDTALKMKLKGFVGINPKLDYVPHRMTRRFREAIDNGPGDPYYDAMYKAAKVREKGVDVAAFIKSQTIEMENKNLERPRTTDLPWEVDVNGKMEKVFETDPQLLFQHLRAASRRLAIVKEFGQGELVDKLNNLVGQHSRQRQLTEGISSGKETKWARDFIMDFQGIHERPLPRGVRDVINVARTGQLGMAVVTNAGLGFVPGAAMFGVSTAKTVNNIVESFRGSTRLEKFRQVGAWHEDAMVKLSDIKDITGWSGKLARRVLGMTGFNYVNRLINKFSIIQAIDYYTEAARKGDMNRLMELERNFAFDKARIDRILKTKKLTEFDEIQISRQAPALTNVSGETALNRQPWMDMPLAKSLMAYTSIVRALGKVSEEAVVRAWKHNDYKMLATLMVGNVAGSEATVLVKNWMKGKEREEGETAWLRLYEDLLYPSPGGLGQHAIEMVVRGAKYRKPLSSSVIGGYGQFIESFYTETAKLSIGEKPDFRKAVKRNFPLARVGENILGIEKR